MFHAQFLYAYLQQLSYRHFTSYETITLTKVADYSKTHHYTKHNHSWGLQCSAATSKLCWHYWWYKTQMWNYRVVFRGTIPIFIYMNIRQFVLKLFMGHPHWYPISLCFPFCNASSLNRLGALVYRNAFNSISILNNTHNLSLKTKTLSASLNTCAMHMYWH